MTDVSNNKEFSQLFLLGFDLSPTKDIPTLIVAKRIGSNMVIHNRIIGKEVIDIYNKLMYFEKKEVREFAEQIFAGMAEGVRKTPSLVIYDEEATKSKGETP